VVSFSAKSTERLAWQLEQKFLVRHEKNLAYISFEFKGGWFIFLS
jgi:hypothetical protein